MTSHSVMKNHLVHVDAKSMPYFYKLMKINS